MNKKGLKSTGNSQIVFDKQRQIELERIVEAAFRGIVKNFNCIVLSTMGNVINKTLTQHGFEKVSRQLFEKAPDCFTIGYNKRDCECIMLNKYPADSEFSLKPHSPLSAFSGEDRQIISRIYSGLLKTYATLDVPVESVRKYVVQNRLILPHVAPNSDALFALLCKVYGSVVRTNGENTPEECYLLLRKTRPIPQTTVDAVKRIVRRFFMGRELVSNTDVGLVLKNNGIYFKDYDYPDLTGFLRSFKDIFTIVPIKDEKTGRIQINVRILKEAIQGDDPQCAEMLAKISAMLQGDRCEEIFNASILRQALELNTPEIWDMVIQAASKADDFGTAVVLTDWEKLVITLDSRMLKVIEDDEFMATYGIDDRQRLDIKNAVRDTIYGKKATWNFSTIGKRIQDFCATNHRLASIFFQLGLVAGDDTDRKYCFLYYAVACAKISFDRFCSVWKQYRENSIDNNAMRHMVTYLYNACCFDAVIYAIENIPSKLSLSDALRVYSAYSTDIVSPLSTGDYLSLAGFSSNRAEEVISRYLDAMINQGRMDDLCSIVSQCILSPEKYIGKDELLSLLAARKSYLDSIKSIIIERAMEMHYSYWVCLNFFFDNNLVSDINGEWDRFSNSCKAGLMAEIDAADNEKQRIEAIKKAMLFFPNEKAFSEDSYDVMSASLRGAPIEQAYESCKKLISTSNFGVLIQLYENKDIPANDAQILSWVSRSYQAEGKSIHAAKSKLSEVLLYKPHGSEAKENVVQLVDLVYTGYTDGSLLQIGSSDAEKILRTCKNYKCEKEQVSNYSIAMLGLAFSADLVPLFTLLFSLLPDGVKNSHKDLCAIVEDRIASGDVAYAMKVTNFAKVYERILVTDSIEVIDLCNDVVCNLLQDEIATLETQYEVLSAAHNKQIDGEHAVKLVMACSHSDKAWRVLSKYSHAAKKFALNYLANFMLVYRFKETSHFLENITSAMKKWGDGSLPPNYLQNNLYLITSTARVDAYFVEFRKHIAKNNSFVSVPKEIFTAYYQALAAKQFLREDECLLLIDILLQTQSFDEFFEKVLFKSSVFENYLLENSQHTIRFLSIFASNRQYQLTQEQLDRINAIRAQANVSILTTNDKAAMRWIDELLKLRFDRSVEDSFFEISGRILANYPIQPRKDLIQESIIPQEFNAPIDINLISHWVDTFECFEVVAKAYYGLYRRRPTDAEARLRTYRLVYSLVRRLIALNEGPESQRIGDYPRECKNYYALKALVNDNNAESAQFMQKMRDGFALKHEYNEVTSFSAGLRKLQNSGVDVDVIEDIIHCGITNYWDAFLDKIILMPDSATSIAGPLTDYLQVLDGRPFRRRLLQIFLIANATALYKVTDGIPALTKGISDEIKSFSGRIDNGEIDLKDFLTDYRRLSIQLYPGIERIISHYDSLSSSEEKIEWLGSLDFALANLKLAISKDWDKLVFTLAAGDVPLLHEVFVPCLVFIQTDKEIHRVAHILLSGENPLTTRFLTDSLFQLTIGEFYSKYYVACHYVNTGKYDEAKATISGIAIVPDEMAGNFEILSTAIRDKQKIEITLSGICSSKEDLLPQFSFMQMQNSDLGGRSLENLIAEFASETSMHDPSTKCQIAQKIYYYLATGSSMQDATDFAFRWGFYAIAAEKNIDRRIAILFELLDEVEELKVKLKFRNNFIEEFLKILNSCKFSLICKYIPSIKDHYKVLYTHYKPIENHQCYAQLILLLSKLHAMANGDEDPAKAMQQGKNIQKAILAVSADYPQNRFAQSSVAFAEAYLHLINERGLFEVRVLNENGVFDGSVFYQIINIGTETIPEISIIMHIEGHNDTTIVKVNVNDEFPGGLRPGQIFAGEYTPAVNVQEGQQVTFVLRLEYGDRNYEATKTILSVQKEDYIYHKAPAGGYIGGTISKRQCKERFIERQELESIIGGLTRQENIVLYGTNGTGKSSILNWLVKVQIPQLCMDAWDMFPVSIIIESKSDCTEEQTINILLDKICSEGSSLVEAIESLSDDHPDIDFSKTLKMLARAVEKRKHLVVMEENGPNPNHILELFSIISSALEGSNIVLFILWDNFEKVISSPNINPRHMEFLRSISEKASGNILFVFSGSNYLLEAVGTAGGSGPWNEIFSRSGTTPVKIGNLFYQPSKSPNYIADNQYDFVRLMSQKQALNNGEIHYSAEAIEYLWRYTNGHAFYSCLLGNRTLEILSSRKVTRRCIYPSDIFNAIYKSNKFMPANHSDKSKETAIEKQIFQDISENVAVKCVGMVLAQEIASGLVRVPRSHLQELVATNRPDISIGDIKRAIDILEARDFIQRIESTTSTDSVPSSGSDCEYVFTSDLYLERFINISIPQIETRVLEDIERKKRTLGDVVGEFQKALIDGGFTQDELEKVKTLTGDSIRNFINTQGGDIAIGGDITKQYVQINAQSITNTLNGILAAGQDCGHLLSGIADLPRLSQYINGTSDYGEADVVSGASEVRIAKAIDAYVADYEEALGQIDDVDQAGEAAEQETDDYIASILRIDSAEFEVFQNQYGIPEAFLNSLRFAHKLEKIFDQGGIDLPDGEIDYSPVTIMYCKLIESMLKEYHLELYELILPNESTQVNKNKSEKYLFGDIRDARIFVSEKITIGPFYYAIDYENPKSRNAQKNIRALAQKGPGTFDEWKAHAQALKQIADIRNKSAHGNKNKKIAKSVKNQLIQLLFDGDAGPGEFLRIIRISRAKTEW